MTQRRGGTARPVPDLEVIWLWLLPIGLGIGPMITAGTVIVQSLVPRQRIGAASGSLTLFNQIGAVMGLAVVGSVFSSVYQAQLPHSLAARECHPT